ncbi:hypothetical protein [Streptomyces sp. RPT161]|uniref:hypothetical protein n=1 Tax=Streptomyces sp. RPT161 TaxID=3015993 RepID=UPI0022B8868D|nr:hypothetical protein [Streptomyces sp. RPT161]
MIHRKGIAAAAATLALGTGLAIGAPAQAAPNAPAAGWHLLWSDSTHEAQSYWPTPDFVPDVNNLEVNFGCYGHDGATIKAQIVRTRDKHVVKTAGVNEGYCNNGQQYRLDVAEKLRAGEAYYLRLTIHGKKHTMYAKAWTYHY